MILKLQIIDDDGTIRAEASGPAHQPVQWKSPPNIPIIAARGGDNGVYKIYAVTAVPVTVLELQHGKPLNPNAYKIF
jgi:hypothetical protein